MCKMATVRRVFMTVLILASGCGGSPNVQVNETNSNTTSYDEIIHINNCGGKADSEQIASRSFATNIEGDVEVGVRQVIESSISAKYSQYRNVSKSQRLVAPPATNMEFVLRWSEEVHAGNVIVDGSARTYEVRIPIAVEQVSAKDLGCDGESRPQPTSGSEMIVPSPTSQVPPVVPTSSPMLVADTPPGTILDIGQTWYQQGLELTLTKANMVVRWSYSGVDVFLALKNNKPNQIAFKVATRTDAQFFASDNRGRNLPVVLYDNRWGDTFTIEGDYRPFSETIMLDSGQATLIPADTVNLCVQVDITDSQITYVILTVTNLSSVTNARWQIPITH